MNINKNKVELLSPAGDFSCVKAAIKAGADAVYMGGAKYGARAFAKSVEENSIIDAIKYVHNAGKKLYITVNTLFKQKELKEIFLFLDPIVDAGVDALIIQDFGVGELIKKHYSSTGLPFELHASTQMTITSSKGINLVKKLGYSQVVLARELSISEIKKIKKEVGDDIRLECFVHGSMCYSYSGACLMSSFIGGESGNRGRCKGPCRLPYTRTGRDPRSFVAGALAPYPRTGRPAGDKEATGLPVQSRDPRSFVAGARAPVGDNDKYLLSMKDMCALNVVNDLISAGISSFKIEGRMRKPEYVEGVTKTYRKYIDFCTGRDPRSFVAGVQAPMGDIILDEAYLLSLYNKGGFTNYYDKHNDVSMIQRYER